MNATAPLKTEDYPPPVLVIGEERFVGRNFPDTDALHEQWEMMESAPPEDDPGFGLHCIQTTTVLLTRLGFDPVKVGAALGRAGIPPETFFARCNRLLEDQVAIHYSDQSPTFGVLAELLLDRWRGGFA